MPVPKHKITPEALLELKMPADVRIAPGGSRVAFTVSETEDEYSRTTQYLAVVSTQGDAGLRRLTHSKADESEPYWSPDGKWLAFLTAREDEASEEPDSFDEDSAGGKPQVWLLPMDGLGGEAEKLTDAPEGIEAYEWLPDSLGVIYLTREPRAAPWKADRTARQDRKDDAFVEREEKFRHQIWQILLEEKKPKRIHAGDFGIGEIAVSPDGQFVAYSTNYTGEENDYHLVDLWVLERASGRVWALTEGPGGKFHPVWTPDSRRVLYTRSLNPALSFSQEHLFAVSISDRETEHLTVGLSQDLSGWQGIWPDRTGALYLSVALGTTTGIFRRAPGETSFAPFIHEEAHVHEFHVSPQGDIALVRSSASEVPEVCWLAAGQQEQTVLTDLNADWAEKYQMAETEIVHYAAPDGQRIEALLTLPIDHDPSIPFPLILSIHGGPHARVVQALTPYSSAQVWAAAGYAVLSPNYRGSEGYGEAFGTASRGDLGGGDYSDVLAGVDWAITEGIADPERLGVIGSSYGGYLVNWILARTTRFQAAVSQFGIYSLETDFSNSQAPRWDVEYLGGYPWEKRETYLRLSPSSEAHQIQTPVLIMHGEGDANTFIANSQEMYQALWLLGKPVEFVRYPREGHGFFEPQHRLDEMRRTLSWFDRYLLPSPLRCFRIGDKMAHNGWELQVTSAAITPYRGRPAPQNGQWLEVELALRDREERRLSYLLRPADFVLTEVRTGRRSFPTGLPVDSLGAKTLAEGRGWKFALAPGEDDPGLAASVAVVFRVRRAGGMYRLTVTDFPSVTLILPPADSAP